MAKGWLPGVARPRMGGDARPPRVDFLLGMT